jgi:hypothetical protein
MRQKGSGQQCLQWMPYTCKRRLENHVNQYPGLWTDITLGKSEADAQAKLETILRLSKHLDFTSRINVPPVQWVETLPLLQPHVGRIKQIVVMSQLQESPDTTKVAEFLHDFFPSLGQLPSLEILQGHI